MISDLEARKIASEWHSGQTSALYALSSTGAILDHVDTANELTDLAREESNRPTDQRNDPASFTNLINLRTYVRRHGNRGPQDHWSNLTW